METKPIYEADTKFSQINFQQVYYEQFIAVCQVPRYKMYSEETLRSK